MAMSRSRRERSAPEPPPLSGWLSRWAAGRWTVPDQVTSSCSLLSATVVYDNILGWSVLLSNTTFCRPTVRLWTKLRVHRPVAGSGYLRPLPRCRAAWPSSRPASRSSRARAASRWWRPPPIGPRPELQDERTGRRHDFAHKSDLLHSAILLPAGAPDELADRERLWNAVEAEREAQGRAAGARRRVLAAARAVGSGEHRAGPGDRAGAVRRPRHDRRSQRASRRADAGRQRHQDPRPCAADAAPGGPGRVRAQGAGLERQGAGRRLARAAGHARQPAPRGTGDRGPGRPSQLCRRAGWRSRAAATRRPSAGPGGWRSRRRWRRATRSASSPIRRWLWPC